MRIIGWADEDHERHEGAPLSPVHVCGVCVEAADDDGNPLYFWCWIPVPFDTLDEWDQFIKAILTSEDEDGIG